jgi:hypothetical protein
MSGDVPYDRTWLRRATDRIPVIAANLVAVLAIALWSYWLAFAIFWRSAHGSSKFPIVDGFAIEVPALALLLLLPLTYLLNAVWKSPATLVFVSLAGALCVPLYLAYLLGLSL